MNFDLETYLSDKKEVLKLNDLDSKINDIIKGNLSGNTETTNFDPLNGRFSWLKSELTVFSGYAGHGKSTFLMFLCVLKAKQNGDKFVFFSPESNPNEYFFKDLMDIYAKEIYFENLSDRQIKEAKDFINEHFILISCSINNRTQQFINNKFKECKEKYGADFCIIDPFNQLDHEWNKQGRDDRYLSEFLTRQKVMAEDLNINMIIVAHPNTPQRSKDIKDYDMPNMYNLHGGSMWGNKIDNLIIVHRPKYWTEKDNNDVIINIDKIKKQKVVGRPGIIELKYNWRTCQYYQYEENETKINNYYEATKIEEPF